MAAQKPLRTFVKTDPKTGRQMQRVAYTPGDVVRLTFDGWQEKPAEPAAETAPDKPVEGTAGKAKPAGTPKSTT